MFNKWKEYFLSLITTRILYLLVFFSVLCGILIYTVFDLQIINGEDYQNNFQLRIKKERSIDAARGNIYDCNGVLLAYNQLAYSVTIEDVFESGKTKNAKLNNTILKAINIIEENGDTVSYDFGIVVNNKGDYDFSVSGSKLNRFKADIYGYSYIDEMTYAESSSTADDIITYLSGPKRFNIEIENLTKEQRLKLIAIRYAMSLNAYQKYISTTIATDVSDKTVAVIYENSDTLMGVNIAEDTIRVYPNGKYTSQIIGYTGKISSDELYEYSLEDSSYSLNDIVGKIGIEKSMESTLKGKNGSETIYVNTTGKIISSENYVEPKAGNDVYLSIDSKLQEAVYNILEQKLAGILLAKIVNQKEYIPGPKSSSSDILIPIYDVYYALYNNSILDIDHFSADDASDSEKLIYQAYINKKESVMSKLNEELTNKRTKYNKLTVEYKVYENLIEDILLENDILISEKISNSDEMYRTWAIDETISLAEYIEYAISQNWIDNDKLKLTDAYSDSNEIYSAIVDIIESELNESVTFDKLLYKYIIKADSISPRTTCQALIDQDNVEIDNDLLDAWAFGKLTPYEFTIELIKRLTLTPAMLALEPCSASSVITDVNTGKVQALVSYPSYDNNYLANGADVEYLAKITTDLSSPLINYATQQRTAPGSTYKMVSATAGLLEGVIKTNTLFTCTGSFEVTTDTHKCWIYPSRHGALDVTGAINKSCNCFFYNVGYRLSLDDKGVYNSDLGVQKLNKYADMYGLTEKSGVEIEEYSPNPTTSYSVPSAIGQGTNSFTTVGISRYVTAVANSGTVYNLTLLDKIADSDGNVIKWCDATVRNTIEMDDSYWRAIHEGMRRVVADKYYFKTIPFDVAGKTGTAQQSKNSPDHGLFVCYAPYNSPKVSIVTRIANGYTSDYACQCTKDIIAHYFNIEEDIVDGNASEVQATGGGGD